MRLITTLIITSFGFVIAATQAQETGLTATDSNTAVQTSLEPTGTYTVASTERWQQAADQMLEQEEFRQAQAHCGRWLLATEAEYGPDAAQNAAPLTCVGIAQRKLGNFERSTVMFERAISLLETSGQGVFDLKLVEPLSELALTLAGLKQFEISAQVLQRAKDVTHRNLGIFNLEQTEVVTRLASVYNAMADTKGVLREQRFLLQANEETYGETPQLLGALKRMANWYQRAGEISQARSLYRRAIRISEAFFGPNDLRLVQPLRDYASSYRDVPSSVRIMSGEGADSLLKIVDIYQNQESVDQVDLSAAHADVGDWYNVAGRGRPSRKAYRAAWDSLEGHPQADEIRQKMFGTPKEIQYEPVPVQVRFYDALNYPKGDIEITYEFTVTDTGRIRRMRVVEDQIGSKRFAIAVASNVDKSRYRPRLVDGKPVETTNVRKVKKMNFENAASIAPSKASTSESDTDSRDVSEVLEEGQNSTDIILPEPDEELTK